MASKKSISDCGGSKIIKPIPRSNKKKTSKKKK